MTEKPEPIFGLAVNHIFVIMLNREPNSVVPHEGLFTHASTWTLSGGRIRHLMCWKAVLTIIGTLLVAGDDRSHGRVSRSSQC